MAFGVPQTPIPPLKGEVVEPGLRPGEAGGVHSEC
jgi:hypothetical protein